MDFRRCNFKPRPNGLRDHGLAALDFSAFSFWLLFPPALSFLAPNKPRHAYPAEADQIMRLHHDKIMRCSAPQPSTLNPQPFCIVINFLAGLTEAKRTAMEKFKAPALWPKE